MRLSRLRILLTIPFDCNMITCLFFFLPVYICFQTYCKLFGFLRPVKILDKFFRQILDILFILLFISILIYTQLLAIIYTYLFILMFTLYYYMNLLKYGEYKNYRSRHQRCSLRKGILTNFANFTGKQLSQSPFFNIVTGLRSETLKKKYTLAQVFSCEF